ncbi:hypothetical protein AHAS_Ahas05G0193900 [Arachis hypogaea]
MKLNFYIDYLLFQDDICLGMKTNQTFASLQFQYQWPLVFEGFPEDRAASASKSHSQAEKRRREKINAQLATLRKLIPKSDKMDKAALLGSVVDHVKDLKRKAMDVSKSITVPSKTDEVTIIECDPDQDESYAKVKILKHNIHRGDRNRVLPANEEAGSAGGARGCCGWLWVANEEAG